MCFYTFLNIFRVLKLHFLWMAYNLICSVFFLRTKKLHGTSQLHGVSVINVFHLLFKTENI